MAQANETNSTQKALLSTTCLVVAVLFASLCVLLAQALPSTPRENAHAMLEGSDTALLVSECRAVLGDAEVQAALAESPTGTIDLESLPDLPPSLKRLGGFSKSVRMDSISWTQGGGFGVWGVTVYAPGARPSPSAGSNLEYARVTEGLWVYYQIR